MSSFHKEPKDTPTPSQPQNAVLDSGLGSSITPLSGSFGEGYQHLSDSYELDFDDDQDGPQPASLTLLTMVIDNPGPAQQVSGDEQNDGSDSSTVAHSSETGTSSVSTVATNASCSTAHTKPDVSSDSNSLDKRKSNANAACVDPKGDLLLSSSDGCTTATNNNHTDLNSSYVCPSDPIRNGAISDIQDENCSESDNQDAENDTPSPILSHVRAQSLDIIIIRGSVVENRPEVISERILTESGRAHSPP